MAIGLDAGSRRPSSARTVAAWKCAAAVMSSWKNTTSFMAILPRISTWACSLPRILSHYYFLLRNPDRDHPEEKLLHEAKMSLHDYLAWEAFQDQQTQYLGTLSIDDLAMVGLSEE